VALVALHFTGLSSARSDLHQATAKGPLVQVVEAGAAPALREVTVLASVTPYQQATLYAKVSGYLSKVLVDKGDAVKTGQLLATIESQETEAQYNSARADLANKQRIANAMTSFCARMPLPPSRPTRPMPMPESRRPPCSNMRRFDPISAWSRRSTAG
jgi:multidrug efflux pump subunit AcrA (membrane-fusion protein)